MNKGRGTMAFRKHSGDEAGEETKRNRGWLFEEGGVPEDSVFSALMDVKQKHESLKRENQSKQSEKDWLASPLGRASAAKSEGEGFFEIELEVGRTDRDVFFGTKDFGTHKKEDFSGLLSDIESIGWKLEHVGYYYMITGESTRDKLLSSGQSTAVSGKTMGVYLFRNTTRTSE